ncbi:hypothetical protein [Sanguibacter gelidistatuariae]|nr:hypothetical protein [Sanguibacter gelidistatuariae]
MPAPATSSAEAVAAGYVFLDGLTPAAAPNACSLPRSHSGGHLEAIGFDSAFVYDCALVVLAYLARGRPSDRRRAEQIGRTLCLLQERDPAGDGRLRNSYASVRALDEAGAPRVHSAAATTGNQAWAGLAFLALFSDTGDGTFLTAAVRLAEFVRAVAYDSRGSGGFAGGVGEDGSPLRWRSTEHNADSVAFFTRLARVTGDAGWSEMAEAARGFVRSMWRVDVGDGRPGHLLIGTDLDGVTPVVEPVPADAQTWTFLALGDPELAGALDWAWEKLLTQDTGLTGVRASSAADGVWLEGTAHLAAALLTRAQTPAARPEDRARADLLLANVWAAQSQGPHADGHGVPAASSDDADSGFGDRLYASLHTGTTAWALLAAQAVNPLSG